MAVLPDTAKAPADSHLRRNTDEIPAGHNEAMTASVVLLMVIVVSAVLLGETARKSAAPCFRMASPGSPTAA